MSNPPQILEQALARAVASGPKPLLKNKSALERVEYVHWCWPNRTVRSVSRSKKHF